MGSVYNRNKGQKRKRPNWWISFIDENGKRVQAPSKQPTKAMARRMLQQAEANVAAGRTGIQPRREVVRCGPLLREWSETLRNRSKDTDQGRIKNHLLPYFENIGIREVDAGTLMTWCDRQLAGTATTLSTKKIGEATVRHNFNLMSRFLGWCIQHNQIERNAARDVPTNRRPKQSGKQDAPWINDESTVRQIMTALPHPVDLMFYLGNRCGLRTGEISGLRLVDLTNLDREYLVVSKSYDGCLKEDKSNTGKSKIVPLPTDAAEVLGPHLEALRNASRKDSDYVFTSPRRPKNGIRKEYVKDTWNRIRDELGLGSMTWYQATRHSFASRNLAAGASLDEVSAALGHSTPAVTRRHYDHFERRTFSSTLRRGVEEGSPSADVIDLAAHRASRTLTEITEQKRRKKNEI